jgi:ABC-type sugar transport system ATPase subunit
MAFLQVQNITRKIKDVTAVNNVSFTVEPFEKLAIAGETGSGKTSLLQMIGGYVQPTSGNILLNDKRVIGPKEQLLPGNPSIAYLSQHFELRFNYFVHEQLEMANKISDEEATIIYKICRIEHLLKRRVEELSGGERQRVALARVLTGAPELLLLDEPFSNLDAVHKRLIRSVINEVSEELKITCIMISHDATDILSWAERILILKDGIVIQDGKPYEIYYQPVNEYCASLLGDYNLIEDVKVKDKKLFLRPEQIQIVERGNYHATGTVENVFFFGNYFIVEVVTDKQMLTVSTANIKHEKGDMVYLRFPQVGNWYI